MSPPDESFRLFVNMELGRKMKSLERIVAVMRDKDRVFMALEFVFSNGQQLRFSGCSMDDVSDCCCVGVSFPINAAKGERLSAIGVSHSDAKGGSVHALQVC
jgi:hypothetical protein